MSDVFLQEFYKNVKADDWPLIETYCDFINLPTTIKNECYNLHNAQSRITQLEDPEYWRNLVRYGYQYNNLVFVPVAKCASTYYSTLLENLGWQKILLSTVDFDSIFAFGVIMHPLIRYLKGITEWIWQLELLPTYIGDIENQDFFKKLTDALIAPDIHCLPYTAIYGNRLEKINWIPMDNLSDNDIKQHMIQMCKSNGHDIFFPLNDTRIHKSPLEKLNLYNAVKQSFIKKPDKIYTIYSLLANDLKFYHQLINKFSQ